ncbi:MAG: MarR family transcriptional regulator [Deltaproteobacteria bacterium HGW-Deltaproteobacteria-10]|nr:MAG: MarR family transcriptional regulator [Deltaproteobacteria bacterium HGW-Deltaproteobacteria-10]
MKPDQCIFFQLAKANQLGSRFLGQKVAKLNITPIQALVLGFLFDEDNITSSELGKRTGLDSATLTGIIDRLAAAQYIERVENPANRRSNQICLTQPGKAQALEAVQLIVDANREFLKILTEQEQQDFRAVIRKLRDQSV